MSNDNEMVERGAKAIYEARNGAGCKPWSRLSGAYKRPYLLDMRAAIAAMREPTDVMLAAAQWRFTGDNLTVSFCVEANTEAHVAWKTMIDAALKGDE